jgi:hypothetical protein
VSSRQTVTKLEAARRQLETAVRLYFASDDAVSIHTLAAAAHQVLADLSVVRGGSPTISETILKLLSPEAQKEARRHVAAAENFLKHAERDPDAILEFDPELTELLLLQACTRYRELAPEPAPALMVYEGWVLVGPWARLIKPGLVPQLDAFRALYPGATRASFFAEALPLVSKFGRSSNREGSE